LRFNRGSKRRLERIRIKGNTPLSVVLLAIALVAFMLFTLTYMAAHPELHAHH
jgi:hypothetical protein